MTTDEAIARIRSYRNCGHPAIGPIMEAAEVLWAEAQRLEEENGLYEAMKEGVTIRIAELEAEVRTLTTQRDEWRDRFSSVESMLQSWKNAAIANANCIAEREAEIERLKADRDRILIESEAFQIEVRDALGCPDDGVPFTEHIRRLRAEHTPESYWDAAHPDHAAQDIEEIADRYNHGDIVELIPIRELPTVWLLVTNGELVTYDTREAAEAAGKAVA